MKPWVSFKFVLGLLALVVVGGAALILQRQETVALRSELELTRLESGELARLRAENQKLKDKQISVAELERLRADHVALPRLRAELESLKQSPSGIRP